MNPTSARPVASVAGVRTAIRFDPLPENETLPEGITAGFSEYMLTVKLPAGVSPSPTVKGIAAVGVFTVVIWFGTLEMLGAPTMTRNGRMVVLLSPSVTEIVI